MTNLNQARYNEDIAKTLMEKSYGDWSVTALFYSALHYVQHAVPGAQNLDRHELRNDYLKRNRPDIFKPYKILYDRSQQARYFPAAAHRIRTSTGSFVPEVKSVLDTLKQILGV